MAEVTQAPTTQPPPTTASTPNKSNGSAAPVVVQEIPLDHIFESKTNPRRSWDEKADAELTDSVRQHGVLQPVLVRPRKSVPWDYEIVAGARRYRAAKKAGLKTIVARVMELSDQQALEVQIIENLQREDVKPIEEGQGYRTLLAEMAKADPKRAGDGQGVRRQDLVEQIAKKVGKSVRYVYARMKLTELIPEIQQALEKGELAASHADLLVRIPASQQKKALALCYQDEWQSGKRVAVLVSVREFAARLERQFNLGLDAAPWKKDDATLVPKAGACTACPHNSSNDPLRPEDAPTNRCLNPSCFNEKLAAFVQLRVKSLGGTVPRLLGGYGYSGNDLSKLQRESKAPLLQRYEWERYKVNKGSCPDAKPAVVVDGGDAGEVVYLCRNAKCKKHHHAESAAGRPAKASPGAVEAEKRKQEQDAVAQQAIFKAALAKVKSLGSAEMGLLAYHLVQVSDFSYGDADKVIAQQVGWECPKGGAPYDWLWQQWKKVGARLTLEQKAQFIMGCVLGNFLGGYHSSELEEGAESLKVDVKAVRAKAIADLKEARLKPPASTLTPQKQKLLLRAFHTYADAAKRWSKVRAKGLSDADLQVRISCELGNGGSSTDEGNVSYKGGANPRVWFAMTDQGKPSLQGAELLREARAVLAIPYTAQTSAKPAKKAAAKKKGGR